MPIVKLKHMSESKLFVSLNREEHYHWNQKGYEFLIVRQLNFLDCEATPPEGEELPVEVCDNLLDGYADYKYILANRGDNFELISPKTIVGGDTWSIAVPDGVKVRRVSRRGYVGFLSEAARRARAGRTGFIHTGTSMGLSVRVSSPFKEVGSYRVQEDPLEVSFHVYIREGTAKSVARRYLRRMDREVMAMVKKARRKGATVAVVDLWARVGKLRLEAPEDITASPERNQIQRITNWFWEIATDLSW